VAIRGDCTRIVSRGNDGTVRVWDAESGLEKLTLKESAGRDTSVAINSDGKGIVSRGSDG
jgi:WD40 repeat protein